VEKSQSTLKRTALKYKKEETYAHRKRARSALSRERTLELVTVMHNKSGVLGPTRRES
jgi:hypothetical protein